MRRIIIICIISIMFLMIGCTKVDQPAEMIENSNNNTIIDETVEADGGEKLNFTLIGLVIDDDGSDSSNMIMFGFLQTAQNLGYASKVYRITAETPYDKVLDNAVLDGVDALMIYSPNGVNDQAVTKAIQLEIKTVVPYDECNVEGISANVVADREEYYDELARGIAERMTERSLKSGRILVYGRSTDECFNAFSKTINSYYPQFGVVAFNRSAADAESAVTELADFILYNRDIKGMYVVDSDLSVVAVNARSAAQQTFKKYGAPTSSPTPSGEDNTEVLPTPNPALLKQISITVFCNGLGDENYTLFNDNDIYALCIEPYYEAASQGVMLMDKLVKGESVAPVTKVNRPIVYADTAEKYKAIYDKMKEMFSLGEK